MRLINTYIFLTVSILSLGYVYSKAVVEQNGEIFSAELDVIRPWEDNCNYYKQLNYSHPYCYNCSIRPCKLNYLFLIPVRANFISPSGYILCIAVEYLISDNNPRRIYIVAIVFFKVSSCYYGTITLL